MWACACVYMHMSTGVEEGQETAWYEVTSRYQLLGVSAGNWARALYKSSVCFQPSIHLPCPVLYSPRAPCCLRANYKPSLMTGQFFRYQGWDCSCSTLYVVHVWRHVYSVASYTIHRKSMKSCQFLWKQSYTQHKEEHTAFVQPITISSWSHKLQASQQNIQ